MASPTLTETEVEIVKLTSQHLALKNMIIEIVGILSAYEKQDSAMFGNYGNVQTLLTALLDMQTEVTEKIRSLTNAVSTV